MTSFTTETPGAGTGGRPGPAGGCGRLRAAEFQRAAVACDVTGHPVIFSLFDFLFDFFFLLPDSVDEITARIPLRSGCFKAELIP